VEEVEEGNEEELEEKVEEVEEVEEGNEEELEEEVEELDKENEVEDMSRKRSSVRSTCVVFGWLFDLKKEKVSSSPEASSESSSSSSSKSSSKKSFSVIIMSASPSRRGGVSSMDWVGSIGSFFFFPVAAVLVKVGRNCVAVKISLAFISSPHLHLSKSQDWTLMANVTKISSNKVFMAELLASRSRSL
jgi:hypothetical protein